MKLPLRFVHCEPFGSFIDGPDPVSGNYDALLDANDEIVAEYAGCGTHEFSFDPEFVKLVEDIKRREELFNRVVDELVNVSVDDISDRSASIDQDTIELHQYAEQLRREYKGQ